MFLMTTTALQCNNIMKKILPESIRETFLYVDGIFDSSGLHEDWHLFDSHSNDILLWSA